jgi:hypothetical protein
MDGKDGWGLVVLMNADSQLAGSEPFRALAGGIFQRLTGVEPPGFGPTLQAQYLVIDAVLVALSAGLLWHMAPAWRAGRGGSVSRSVRTDVTT